MEVDIGGGQGATTGRRPLSFIDGSYLQPRAQFQMQMRWLPHWICIGSSLPRNTVQLT